MGPLHVLSIILVSTLSFVSANRQCTNPKVRKEWRSLCADERASWINAVKCLSNLPHNPRIAASVNSTLSLIPPLATNSSYYDDFVYIHMDLNVLIHNTGFFFPWHRIYVQTFEDELRSKCGYDGVQPYWNWTLDSADFYHATILSSSEYEGLGTWGDPKNDYRLVDGGFKDFKLAYPVPHSLRRNYTNQPFIGLTLPAGSSPIPDPEIMMNATITNEVTNNIINSYTGEYIQFQAALENIPGPHPAPHLILGGDGGGTCPFGLAPPACYPGPRWSPNDPTFFLHHAMIDKIWYDWQHRDSGNANIFGGGTVSYQVNSSQSFAEYPTGSPPWLNTSSVMPSDGMWEETRVSEVMDTVGGKLCYIYA